MYQYGTVGEVSKLPVANVWNSKMIPNFVKHEVNI
jgi:hypothetical protein